MPTIRIEIPIVSAASTATVRVHQADRDSGNAAPLLVEHDAHETRDRGSERGERRNAECEHDPEIAPRHGEDRAEQVLEEPDVEPVGATTTRTTPSAMPV